MKPVTLDDPCPSCGGGHVFRYEDETFLVECDSCSFTVEIGVPPSTFTDCDREDMPEVASRYFRSTLQHMKNSFCPICDGPARTTVGPMETLIDSTDGMADESRDYLWVLFDCQQCGATPRAGPGLLLLDHPAVASFYFDRGIDVTERPLWGFNVADTATGTTRSGDPVRASVTYRAEDNTLTVVFDESLDVVDVER